MVPGLRSEYGWKKKYDNIKFQVVDIVVEPRRVAQYLVILFNQELTFVEHLKHNFHSDTLHTLGMMRAVCF